jgi:hypothetical protein
VRWERLFGDLEGQAEQAERDDEVLLAADRLRAEHAAVGLVDRLRAAVGRPLVVRGGDGVTVRGRALAVGPDWLALAHAVDALDAVRSVGAVDTVHLVPIAQVCSVAGLPEAAVPPQAVRAVDHGKDLAFLLRHVAALGVEVVVSTAAGDLRGLLTRVGRDYVDVDSGTEVWSVPWGSLLRVRLA